MVAAAALVSLTSAADPQNVSFGERLYQEKADCQFCHGPDGDGRSDKGLRRC
jgi:cytochrome c